MLNNSNKMSDIIKRTRRNKFFHNSNSSPSILLAFLVIFFCFQIVPIDGAVHSVFTTSNLLGQSITSSTLVWETYNARDSKQLEFAVEGGKYITGDEHYPIYVCRITIDGVPTSGHTEKIKQTHVCVAAHYKHDKFKNFDILVNKGHLGKVVWKHWSRFNDGVPIGAVRIAEDNYIARHVAVPQTQQQLEKPEEANDNERHFGADYNLGRLDKVGLGKIKVVINGIDKEYNDGEVLVETEPFRYELRDIKLDKIRLDLRDNLTELASSILINHGNEYSVVETVMSYQFDYVQYWGTHEGAARGLPTKVYEKDSDKPTNIYWGLKFSEKRFETKSVQTKLYPGTALNVTLRGNYVTLEAPYKAKLHAFYQGSDESVSRDITAEVRKSYLKDVKLEFSPRYWIENGTLIPTTTTSTTSTSTSTTTHATTTSTKDPLPIHEPPVVHMKNVGEVHSGPDQLEKSLHETQMSNEIPNEVPENLSEKQTKPVLAGVAAGHGHSNNNAFTATTNISILLLSTLATLFLTVFAINI